MTKETILGYSAYTALRVLNTTLSWYTAGEIFDSDFRSNETPSIFAFWHSDQLLMSWPYLSHKTPLFSKPLSVLISMHSDGRIAAKTLSYLGLDCVPGSSSRGGTKALLQMKKLLENGHHIAITPDGPRGPACTAKQGVIALASMTGSPIIPVGIHASSCWEFNSWDKMFLPKPFSKIAVASGKKFSVDKGIDRTQFLDKAKELTKELNKAKTQAKAML